MIKRFLLKSKTIFGVGFFGVLLTIGLLYLNANAGEPAKYVNPLIAFKTS